MSGVTSFRDALGQKPEVGDLIFYGQTGRYSEFMVGRVIKLTPKGVRILKLKGSRTKYLGSSPEEIQVSVGSHAVIITEVSAAQKYANGQTKKLKEV